MSYNPDIHHRKSIRLKNYDYSKEGLYFITICTQNREKIFGEIINVGAGFSCPIMKLNQIGNTIERVYEELANKFENIKCNEFVIMPNHFHCIIEIIENTEGGKTPPLPNIIGYFKFQTTKIYNEISNVKNEKFISLWQRNYYENIIRNEKAHLKVSEYINNNPQRWVEDKYYE